MNDKIIVALDVPTASEACILIHQLHKHIQYFKIGLELISSQRAGEVVAVANNYGVKVFWDNKLNDIPNTVGRTTATLSKMNISMLNVHALAGPKAMQACVHNAGSMEILAVTLLTSLTAEDLTKLSFNCTIKDAVKCLAMNAKEAGVHGLICSASDIQWMRDNSDLDNMKLVTPGIRPTWAANNDQKRITTPKDALDLGADHMVIGRPITQPPDNMSPGDAAQRILDEIE